MVDKAKIIADLDKLLEQWRLHVNADSKLEECPTCHNLGILDISQFVHVITDYAPIGCCIVCAEDKTLEWNSKQIAYTEFNPDEWKGIWPPENTNQVATEIICTCDISIGGCTCGAFKKEMELKHGKRKSRRA